MISKIVNSLVKGKKDLWNYKFQNKVAGRKAQLGGIGDRSLKISLETSKDYPNLDINGFLNWKDYNKFTDKEKALVQALLDELELKAH